MERACFFWISNIAHWFSENNSFIVINRIWMNWETISMILWQSYLLSWITEILGVERRFLNDYSFEEQVCKNQATRDKINGTSSNSYYLEKRRYNFFWTVFFLSNADLIEILQLSSRKISIYSRTRKWSRIRVIFLEQTIIKRHSSNQIIQNNIWNACLDQRKFLMRLEHCLLLSIDNRFIKNLINLTTVLQHHRWFINWRIINLQE